MQNIQRMLVLVATAVVVHWAIFPTANADECKNICDVEFRTTTTINCGTPFTSPPCSGTCLDELRAHHNCRRPGRFEENHNPCNIMRDDVLRALITEMSCYAKGIVGTQQCECNDRDIKNRWMVDVPAQICDCVRP